MLKMTKIPESSVPIMPGPMRRYAQWPPKIIDVQCLGYIKDSNGRTYPRDIGRSSVLAGSSVLFQFGDTFAHDANGKFIEATSSTAAAVLDPREAPTITSYALYENGKVPSFVPMFPDERGVHDKRIILWSFGGIIEIGRADGGVAAGWAFYQKGSHHYPHTREIALEYTGAVKVFYNFINNKITVSRPKDSLVLFKKMEPAFGTFSAVAHEGNAYLFGHSYGSTKVMLARVNVRWVLDRSRYMYWDGQKYQTCMDKCKQVMGDVQHGAIYRSKLFEPTRGRDWVFIGCSAFGDNKVLLGVSANLEGPYTTVELTYTFPLQPMPEGSYRYCVYPHPWAFDEEKGELMITWSEGGIYGEIVAVKVQFDMTMEVGRPSLSIAGQSKSTKDRCVIV